MVFGTAKLYNLSCHFGFRCIRLSELKDQNLWMYDLILVHWLYDYTIWVADSYAKKVITSQNYNENSADIVVGTE